MEYAWALTIGFALGLAYFAGLWLTVRWAVRSRRAAAIFGMSFLLRSLLLAAGLLLLIGADGPRLAVALLGVVFARFVGLVLFPSTAANREPER